MSNFEKNLERLKCLVFEDEDLSKAQTLITAMVKEVATDIEIDNFSEFLSISADAIEDIENSIIYDTVTDWSLSIYQQKKASEPIASLKYADAINSWLNYKLELLENPATSRESNLTLSLYEDIVDNSDRTTADNELTNNYQGYATYSLLVGLSKSNLALIDKAIEAQRKVLQLYKTGKFPDYYNLDTFVAIAKRSLASTLMEAYEFDKNRYSNYLEEIEELLKSAQKDFEICGTDFDREYNMNLLEKIRSYGS